MWTAQKNRLNTLRSARRWCLWVGLVALAVAIISGFGGMAYKDQCLPRTGHCEGDLIQGALVVVYFGSLIAVALCLVAGLVLWTLVALRGVAQHKTRA